MAIRIIITLHAVAGKGAELAAAFRARCAEVMQEPGCEQFEVFQSVVDPDKLVLLEHWADEAALEAAPAGERHAVAAAERAQDWAGRARGLRIQP